MRLLAIQPVNGGESQITFATRPGRRYVLESAAVLPTAAWQPASAIVEATADHTVVSVNNLPAGSAFVRIRLPP